MRNKIRIDRFVELKILDGQRSTYFDELFRHGYEYSQEEIPKNKVKEIS